MASQSLIRWQRDARAELDDIAHAALGGSGHARRVATVQINHAYAVLLSSQFQRYCRDLHSEASEQLCAALPAWSGPILRARLAEARKLDTGTTSADLASTCGRSCERAARGPMAGKLAWSSSTGGATPSRTRTSPTPPGSTSGTAAPTSGWPTCGRGEPRATGWRRR